MMRRSMPGPPLLLPAALAATFWLALTAGASEESVTVNITRDDCARLVEHVPDPDVAYRPGVDVYGRPVAPADLDGGPAVALPETIAIRIEVELFERFGIPRDPALYDGDAEIGYAVYRDGRFFFNGQPLRSEAEAELARRCQVILRTPR